MDALLRQWQARHLPLGLPLRVPRPDQQAPSGHALAARMSSHQEKVVTIGAGPVSLKGTPGEVERLAAAAGLYGEAIHPDRMPKDEDHVMTGVYIGAGILLAAGAAYLAWRFLLSDEQKQRVVTSTKDLVADGLTASKRAVRDARQKMPF